MFISIPYRGFICRQFFYDDDLAYSYGCIRFLVVVFMNCIPLLIVIEMDVCIVSHGVTCHIPKI